MLTILNIVSSLLDYLAWLTAPSGPPKKLNYCRVGLGQNGILQNDQQRLPNEDVTDENDVYSAPHDAFDGLDVTPLEAAFSEAAECVNTLAKSLDSTNLLKLYGLYKVANDGPCPGSDPVTPRPPIWDVKGRQKWDAWLAVGEIDRDTAMNRYIDLAKSLTPFQDATCDPSSETVKGQHSAGSLGVGFSRPVISEAESPDSGIPDQNDPADAAVGELLLDDAKEGNVSAFHDNVGLDLLRYRDNRGLTLLHWAVDRGHHDVVDRLISLARSIPDADWSVLAAKHNQVGTSQITFVDWLINSRDYEGQTPLHYAVGSERGDVVNSLIAAGADLQVKDIDGFTPRDLCETEEFSEFFDNCVLKNG